MQTSQGANFLNIMEDLIDLRRELDNDREELKTMTKKLQTLKEDQASHPKKMRKIKINELSSAIETANEDFSRIEAQISILINGLNMLEVLQEMGNNLFELCDKLANLYIYFSFSG